MSPAILLPQLVARTGGSLGAFGCRKMAGNR